MTASLRDQLQAALGTAFTIDRELSGGGMSRVYVVRDTRLDRDIVVKMLSPELAAGISAERFTREIKLAAALQHPHIAPVLSDGVTADGLPFYSMPLVEGESLRARMDVGRVSTEDAMSILRDVAKALAYAHGRGIVHRDIKPENILLSSGTAVVTDFGIAKALQLSRTATSGGPVRDGLTGTGMSLGTPGYMAPEQAAGDPATDHHADIYAWGVVAYELLAGQHPFASRKTPREMLTAHLSEMPTALSVTNGRV
ncbi:MAG: serine/threonine-protein kinase, partial [Gemmatimonadaceae bacterium]